MKNQVNILFISLLIGFVYPCSCLEPLPPEQAYDEADVVLSDMAANTTGNKELDSYKTGELCVKAMNLAKKIFVKLIYLISRVFLAWNFLNFLAHCVFYYIRV